MFRLEDFILRTIKGMVGNEPDYKVQEYALSWYNRGKLTEENLSEIEELIEEKNTVVADDVEEDGLIEVI